MMIKTGTLFNTADKGYEFVFYPGKTFRRWGQRSSTSSSSNSSGGGSSVEFPPSEIILTAILIGIFVIACILVKRHEDQNS